MHVHWFFHGGKSPPLKISIDIKLYTCKLSHKNASTSHFLYLQSSSLAYILNYYEHDCTHGFWRRISLYSYLSYTHAAVFFQLQLFSPIPIPSRIMDQIIKLSIAFSVLTFTSSNTLILNECEDGNERLENVTNLFIINIIFWVEIISIFHQNVSQIISFFFHIVFQFFSFSPCLSHDHIL